MNKAIFKYRTFGIITAIFLTITFIIIIFSNSTGLLQFRYFQIFFYLYLANVVFAWLIVAVLENSKSTDKVFFFLEERPRFPELNSLPAKLGIAVILSFIFIAGLELGLTFIDVPQPFVQQSFSVISEGTQLFYKFVFQSLVPGLGEEFAIFVLCSVIAYILIFVVGLGKSAGQIILSYVISSGLGSIVLTLAHREAYGSDTAAYLGIFLFEWIVQFANLITGMFISWIPHIVHNYAVVFVLATGFSIGGTALFIRNYARREEK